MIIVSAFLFGMCTPSQASIVDLILIENKERLGDCNQLQGAKTAIIETFKKKGISVVPHEYLVSNYLDQFKKDFPEKTTNKKIVLSVNDYGIEALRKMNEQLGNDILTVHLNHQQMTNHDTLLKTDENKYGADAVALPKHAIDQKLRDNLKKSTTKLIETAGVSHNVHPEELNEEFKKLAKNIPGLDNKKAKYLVVVLGGDTQNPDGKSWLYYPEAEAKALAKYAAQMAQEKGYILLVTNGPRTGQYTPRGEKRTVHTKGIVDPVTRAFVDSLPENMIQGKTYELFDFQHGTPSAWKGLLGCLVIHPGSKLLLEGGSTSMVSEALNNLPKEADVTIFSHSGMNTVHDNHMNSEYEAGHVSTLSKEIKLTPRKKVKETKDEPAAQTIANELVSIILK